MANRYNSPREDWRRFEDEQGRRRRKREYDDEFGPGQSRNWISEGQPYERGYRYDYGSGGMRKMPVWRGYRDEDEMEYEAGSYIPGPYTGIGPRGYNRSDEDIFSEVCNRLTDHGDIDAREIEVEVEDGEVTISGTVDSRRTKFMVEDTVDSVPGVNDIQNRLRVRRPPPGEENLRSWAQTSRREEDEWGRRTEPGRRREESQFGERYGEDYGYGREGERIEPQGGRYEEADFIDRYDEPDYTELDRTGPYVGMGPRGYRRSDERISEEVCEQLTRHGDVDASDIEVEVKDSEVILRGTVEDRRTKRIAEDLAESTSGVSEVHNQLRIRRTHFTRGQEKGAGQVGVGQAVIGAEGHTIGVIAEVRDQDMRVKRSNLPDIYIPKNTIQAISGNRVIISVPLREIQDQDWALSERKDS
jgi:osmotically-inducible protein OsmY